jgi:hypothetical protein
VPDLGLAPTPFLAHGGIPGLIAETGSVVVALVIFGYFLWRASKKERDREDRRR